MITDLKIEMVKTLESCLSQRPCYSIWKLCLIDALLSLWLACLCFVSSVFVLVIDAVSFFAIIIPFFLIIIFLFYPNPSSFFAIPSSFLPIITCPTGNLCSLPPATNHMRHRKQEWDDLITPLTTPPHDLRRPLSDWLPHQRPANRYTDWLTDCFVIRVTGLTMTMTVLELVSTVRDWHVIRVTVLILRMIV